MVVHNLMAVHNLLNQYIHRHPPNLMALCYNHTTYRPVIK
jgi:hypothetical protein